MILHWLIWLKPVIMTVKGIKMKVLAENLTIKTKYADLLNEVGEPVGYLRATTHVLAFMPFREVEDGTKFYTSDQVAAAVLKATGQLEEEIERLKGDHEAACVIIADMHAAAVGEVTGPKRGVVEDVADVRSELNSTKEELETERMRLAGCGVAALGYFEGCRDEYKSSSLDDVLRLRQQLQAAQEEIADLKNTIKTRDFEVETLYVRRGESEELKKQLATAEQRVAEACALQVATETKFHWLDAARVAKEIRSGEWRKFVKEV